MPKPVTEQEQKAEKLARNFCNDCFASQGSCYWLNHLLPNEWESYRPFDNCPKFKSIKEMVLLKASVK